MKWFHCFFFVMYFFGAVPAENGRLTVETVPDGAAVYYEGPHQKEYRLLGKSPVMDVEVPEGLFHLLITLDDYDTLSLGGQAVFPGRHKKLHYKLDYSYAFLLVDTRPEGAQVFLDDVKLGLSPYTNRLVLPGSYQLQVSPRDSLFLPLEMNIQLGRGDSFNLQQKHLFRGKSIHSEPLGLVPWRVKAEAGFLRTAYTGKYKSVGNLTCRQMNVTRPCPVSVDTADLNGSNFSSDSVQTSLDMPLVLRLGLPHDIELHLHLPFRQFKSLRDVPGEFGPSDMKVGVKYTLRKYRAAIDAAYKFDNAPFSRGLGTGYKSLTLTGIGMILKKGFQFYGTAGYEFRFSKSDSADLNKGDNIFAYVQAGYLMLPWTPYIGLQGSHFFSDMWGGSVEMENGGFLLMPEAGLIVEPSEGFALQLGIPFSVMGRNAMKRWGVHFSGAVSFRTE